MITKHQGWVTSLQSDTPYVHRLHTKGMCTPRVESGPSQSPAPTASVFFSNSLPPLEGLSRAVLLSSLCPAWMVTSLCDLDLHVQQSQLLCSFDRRAASTFPHRNEGKEERFPLFFGFPGKVKVAQLCPTLCHAMDYPVHRILQARILEWVAFPSSRGSSQPRDRTQVSRIVVGFFTS